MSAFHEEVNIEDMEYDPELKTYFYPCPCGDQFEITLEEVIDGEEAAYCPSCSLVLRVIVDDGFDFPEDEEPQETLQQPIAC
ncbi:hypothetical protein SARC_02020 [Sphaeroforma arctica JP610]|uniref:Diphthamide biosynthesis protein 3 n=1 Tax=Sphaeroforma arctica JP610 TaxID=667725 RepID=A0A0L0G9W5_9EUKA|nr:hypothetical protein SARC_02020 [Sphaeroforma arctica JP610]KNC85795.1 hypothetical protein SARC_02020 [Sphaeroforma arctica JP610]|eukprot:XP_014159697.1 hypothetical protein SARC_02020 [Sphaeroforma arctica JP610]